MSYEILTSDRYAFCPTALSQEFFCKIFSSVTEEFEQELPFMTTLSDIPEVISKVMMFGSRHYSALCLKDNFSPQNSRLNMFFAVKFKKNY